MCRLVRNFAMRHRPMSDEIEGLRGEERGLTDYAGALQISCDHLGNSGEGVNVSLPTLRKHDISRGSLNKTMAELSGMFATAASPGTRPAKRAADQFLHNLARPAIDARDGGRRATGRAIGYSFI